MIEHDFPPDISAELASLVIGNQIGEGKYRKVFVLASDANLVVKVEKPVRGYFNNVMEWELWSYYRGTKWGKWLAPVRDISSNGRVITQVRTMPICIDQLPKKVPNFIEDAHAGNFGMIGKQAVCHDYGFLKIPRKGVKMVKTGWGQ